MKVERIYNYVIMRQQGLKEEFDEKIQECMEAKRNKELHLLPELSTDAKIIKANWKFLREIKEMLQDEITGDNINDRETFSPSNL